LNCCGLMTMTCGERVYTRRVVAGRFLAYKRPASPVPAAAIKSARLTGMLAVIRQRSDRDRHVPRLTGDAEGVDKWAQPPWLQ